MTSSKPKLKIYLARLTSPDGKESFLKIGITSDLEARHSYGLTTIPPGSLPTALQKLQDAILAKSNRMRQPYKWEFLQTVSMNTENDALTHEMLLLEAISPSSYKPKNWFSGSTECFLADDQDVNLIKDYFQSIMP